MARAAGDIVQPVGRTNAPDLVKKAMKERGYTQMKLAKELGYAGSNSIAMQLSGRNMRIDIFVNMLDTLGFDVVVKDRNNRKNVWTVEHIAPDASEE